MLYLLFKGTAALNDAKIKYNDVEQAICAYVYGLLMIFHITGFFNYKTPSKITSPSLIFNWLLF